jgi:hypothetical protein
MSKGNSIFGQILSLFDKNNLKKASRKYDADKHSKGFSSTDHFISMLFCQFAYAKSLREICDGLKSCQDKTMHLGLMRLPTKSNLSYVNSTRPSEFFEEIFYITLKKVQSEHFQRKKKFRFKNKLYSMDASIIDLCLSMYDWAHYRTTKGAIKLHLLLDHDGYLPTFLNITTGKVHEINIARGISLPPGSIIAVDRGYNDYELFYEWTKSKVWFVTRMKENAVYEVIETRIPPENRKIISDEIIRFAGYNAQKKCPILLRRIVAWDEANQREIVLLTNNLKLGASTISAIYKDRWEIELFFKAIKQQLKIKTFVGTSENAVRIQIWTALITILILKYLKFKSTFGWALSNMVALLRLSLLKYADLTSWLNDPFYKAREPDYIEATLFD